MKKLTLLLLLIPILSFGQIKEGIELCFEYKRSISAFTSDKEAEEALDKILSVIGASKNFTLIPCDIFNALAVTYKGERYVLYDGEFMKKISELTNDWSSIFILAHEVGHHINGHTRDFLLASILDDTSLTKQRQEELEADKFAGFVLSKLGASLNQTIAAIDLIATNSDDRYSTHPSKNKRIEAITEGYTGKVVNEENGEPSNNNFDIVFYEDGSRWEGPVIIDEENVAFEGSLMRKINKTPYGEGVFIYPDGKVYKGYFHSSLLERDIEGTYEAAFSLGGKYFNEKDFSKAKKYFTEAINLYEDGLLLDAIFYVAYIDFVHFKKYNTAYEGFETLYNYAGSEYNIEMGSYYYLYKLLEYVSVLEQQKISQSEAFKKRFALIDKIISGPKNQYKGSAYIDKWIYMSQMKETETYYNCELLIKAAEYGESSNLIEFEDGTKSITVKEFIEKYCGIIESTETDQ